MALPTALTNDQIDRLAFKVKENRQLHRGDAEALIAMARERNALIASRPKDIQQQTLTMMGHPWGSP